MHNDTLSYKTNIKALDRGKLSLIYTLEKETKLIVVEVMTTELVIVTSKLFM